MFDVEKFKFPFILPKVNDESLARAFQKYGSFQKAKVVRDKRNGKTKGYGFVSFKSSEDFIKAMREMDGKFLRMYLRILNPKS
jgi:RNA recognition motif-containing protein